MALLEFYPGRKNKKNYKYSFFQSLCVQNSFVNQDYSKICTQGRREFVKSHKVTFYIYRIKVQSYWRFVGSVAALDKLDVVVEEHSGSNHDVVETEEVAEVLQDRGSRSEVSKIKLI